MEKKQDWSGCVISKKCFAIYQKKSDNAIINYLTTNHKILDYSVPMKEGDEHVYVINWLKNTEISRTEVERAFQKHNKSINENVRIKVQNTLNFYDYVYENKYFYDSQTILER